MSAPTGLESNNPITNAAGMNKPSASNALAPTPEVDPKPIEIGTIWANIDAVLEVFLPGMRPTPRLTNHKPANKVKAIRAIKVAKSLAWPVIAP